MITVLTDGLIFGLQHVGGVGRYFTEILSRLGNECVDIQTVLHLPPCQAQFPRVAWIRELRDCNLRPRRAFREVSKVRARWYKPQIFHSTYFTAPYWSGLRTVVTVYDFIDETYDPPIDSWRALIERKKRLIESADAVIAISESTRNGILTYTLASESKISVVYPAAGDAFSAPSDKLQALAAFKERYGLHSPYWLYVGRRQWYKNFATLLLAFLRVAPRVEGDLVVVGGEPSLEPWQVDVLVQHRLKHRVRLLPVVDDDTLVCAYKGAAALVFPSLAEGFGIPLLEAMSCGTPAVVSDLPVFHELAGETPIYFNPHDEEALAGALLQVLDDPTLPGRLALGRQRAQNFSWSASARRVGEVYRSLV